MKFKKQSIIINPLINSYSIKNIYQYYYSKGFLDSINIIKYNLNNYKNNIYYNIYTGNQYIINSIHYNIPSFKLKNSFYQNIQNSYIKIGTPFNLELFQYEIERLSNIYENQYYYNFNILNNLLFQINKNIKKNIINIIINLYKQEIIHNDFLEKKYYYKNIKIKYSTCKNNFIHKLYHGYDFFICSIKKNYNLKKIIDAIVIIPGKKFFNKDILLTKRNFFYLKNSILTELKIKEILTSPIHDIKNLNVHILLTPLKKYEIQLYFETICSQKNNIKINSGINFLIRNFFNKGENLEFLLNKEFNLINKKTISSNNIFNYWIYNIETNLYFPDFQLPLFKNLIIKKYHPRLYLNIKLNINHNNNIINKNSLIYFWNTNYYSTHKIKIFNTFKQHDILYQKYTQIKKKNINTIITKNKLIFYNIYLNHQKYHHNKVYNDISYIYNYNEVFDKQNKQPIFFSTKIKLSDNVLYLLNQYLSQKNNILKLNDYKLFKFDIEYQKYFILTHKHVLKSDFFICLSIPDDSVTNFIFNKKDAYNNNHLKLWYILNLTSGHINKNFRVSFLSNLKIKSNIEYRYKVINDTYIALFLHIGNIWLLQSKFYNKKVIFSLNHIYQEIIVYSGIGLRYDFKYIIARIDLSHKIIDTTKKLWNTSILDHNIINFAIGYPF